VRYAVLFFCCILAGEVLSQDTTFLKVHFLYGSRPKREFQSTERKWFGGKLGGHVGVEADADRIVNFMRSGKFHWFSKRRLRHSRYVAHSTERFYSIFRYDSDSVKKAIVYVPITSSQKQKFDSITSAYMTETPYDYAFFGMRCGAATYEILAQLDILRPYSQGKTVRRIFYPRRLRKRIFRIAGENGWRVEMAGGSTTRWWERDLQEIPIDTSGAKPVAAR